ncbi:MAG: tRNA (N(6)-L-threonylcarbamoyladenosine(37)-C(2))-methylthiotransferase MtaB [Chlamydiae bacterium]|nr:tRNA (N(6)-L-threonylcarbamoyladenosine(37)-C(2))-methylthiotransferase MtaB [Chlamydiota bacterium]
MKKRYKIITLGCRTNQYESQAYKDQLEKLGYEEAFEGQAEFCIVNTCTVTASADQRSRYQIQKLARENQGSRLFVTGCFAERARDEILQIPGVEAVVSNKEKEQLVAYAFPDQSVPEFAIENFQAHTRAFLKVQDGCNSYCSYCVIPFVRGRSRSKRLELIVEEAKALVENGYREIVITGINVGDFDGAPLEGEEPKKLKDVVLALEPIEGLDRIRISSIDPDEVDDELLQVIANSKKACPSMHIVLQSGSNMILKLMRRKYSMQDFYNTVNRLKNASPLFTFTTDVIVGFPGETEQAFMETMEVIEKIEFAKVHMFPFSSRPGTRAERMTGHLPADIIDERKHRILKKADEVAFLLREKYIGKKLQVLLESEDEHRPGYLCGYSENFLRVSVPADGLRTNEIVTVLCESNDHEGLIGCLG